MRIRPFGWIRTLHVACGLALFHSVRYQNVIGPPSAPPAEPDTAESQPDGMSRSRRHRLSPESRARRPKRSRSGRPAAACAAARETYCGAFPPRSTRKRRCCRPLTSCPTPGTGPKTASYDSTRTSVRSRCANSATRLTPWPARTPLLPWPARAGAPASRCTRPCPPRGSARDRPALRARSSPGSSRALRAAPRARESPPSR